MGNLVVSGLIWGEVFSAPQNNDFPAMDTNYKVLTWTFIFDKQFNTFADVQSYERLTIPTFFDSSRTNSDVVYNSITENNMVLISLNRAEIVAKEPWVVAYEAVFRKAIP